MAQYAQACNLYDIPDNGVTITAKLRALADHCTDVGRPFDEIERTVSTWLRPDETPRQLITRAQTFASWGIDHVIAMAPVWTDEALDTVAVAATELGQPIR